MYSFLMRVYGLFECVYLLIKVGYILIVAVDNGLQLFYLLLIIGNFFLMFMFSLFYLTIQLFLYLLSYVVLVFDSVDKRITIFQLQLRL